jgi:uncharacterized protein (TIGR00369 family)
MNASIDVYKNVVEELIPFNKTLGFKLLDVKQDYAAILIPFRPDMIGNPVKRSIHGGVIAAAMDTVGGVAGMTTFTSFEDSLATIDLRIDYLRYGQEKDIKMEAHITKSGSRVIFTQMKAYHVDSPDVLIAEGKGVFSIRRVKKEEK